MKTAAPSNLKIPNKPLLYRENTLSTSDQKKCYKVKNPKSAKLVINSDFSDNKLAKELLNQTKHIRHIEADNIFLKKTSNLNPIIGKNHCKSLRSISLNCNVEKPYKYINEFF